MVTEAEKKLVETIAKKGFNKEEIIALCLVCRQRNMVEDMLNYIEEHQDLDFYKLLEKSVEGLEPLEAFVK